MRHKCLVPAALGVAAAALALSAPAAARTIRGWEVGRNRDFCMMQSSFQDNVTLAFVWHPQSGELGFMAAGEGWTELVGQQGKPATIEITFDGGVPPADWIDEGAHVVLMPDREGVVGGWGSEHSDELANAATHATGVTVRVGKRDLGSFDLSGVPAAYRELMRCGKQFAPDQASR